MVRGLGIHSVGSMMRRARDLWRLLLNLTNGSAYQDGQE